MKIAVDMDGILVNLLGPWLEEYRRRTGHVVTIAELTDWGVEQFANRMTCGGLYAIIEDGEFIRALPPLPGAVDGFEALRAQGHEVVACSSPPSAAGAAAKYAWCAEHLGIDRRDVILAHRKEWLTGVADAIIDDSPSTIGKWATAGRLVATIAYPYNQVVAHACHLRAVGWHDTAHAWREIVKAFAPTRCNECGQTVPL